MRFFILSALCLFAVASAASVPADYDEDDLVARTLKAYQDYVEEAKVNPEEALKKWNAFFESAGGVKSVEKRDVREDIQNFLKDAQAKAKDAGGNFLKDARAKLMQAVQQFLKDAQAKAANVGTEVQKAIDQLFAVAEKKVEESQNVVKRDAENGKLGNVSAGSLLKNIFNPKELQEQLITVLINAMAGRNKRDVREDIQNFLADAQAKAKDAGGNFLKDARVKLMQAVQQFLKDAQSKAANVGAEVQKAIDQLFAVAEKKVEESQNVVKRGVENGKLGNVTAGSLLKNIFNPKELQNQLTTVLINAMAGRNKRDVREDIQNFLKEAQAKAKDAGGNFLKDARAKLMQAVQQFLKDAQAKASNVGVEVQKAIDNLFAVAEKKVEESSAQAA